MTIYGLICNVCEKVGVSYKGRGFGCMCYVGFLYLLVS